MNRRDSTCEPTRHTHTDTRDVNHVSSYQLLLLYIGIQ